MRSFSLTTALAAMYGNFAGAIQTCSTFTQLDGRFEERQCGIDELDDPTTGAFARVFTQFDTHTVTTPDGYELTLVHIDYT